MSIRQTKIKVNSLIISLLFLVIFLVNPVQSQKLIENPDLDKKVKKFLDSHAYQWHEMNVPATDGKLLYDLDSSSKCNM